MGDFHTVECWAVYWVAAGCVLASSSSGRPWWVCSMSSTSCGVMSSAASSSSVSAAKPFDVLGFVDLGAKVLSSSEFERLKNRVDGIFPPPALVAGQPPLARPAADVLPGVVVAPGWKARRAPIFDQVPGSASGVGSGTSPFCLDCPDAFASDIPIPDCPTPIPVLDYCNNNGNDLPLNGHALLLNGNATLLNGNAINTSSIGIGVSGSPAGGESVCDKECSPTPGTLLFGSVETPVPTGMPRSSVVMGKNFGTKRGLKFVQPRVHNGEILVEPPARVGTEGATRWHRTIVGYFLGKAPPLVQGQAIFLSQWKFGMSLQKVQPRRVPVWVKLHNVLLEYWTGNGLSITASAWLPHHCSDLHSVPRAPLWTGIDVHSRLDMVISDGAWDWPVVVRPEILQITSSVPPILGGLDRISWRPHSSGLYSTASAMRFLKGPSNPVPWAPLLRGPGRFALAGHTLIGAWGVFGQLRGGEGSVRVLQTISSRLQNGYWNLSRRSCTEASGFNSTIEPGRIESIVACDCSFDNNTVCHVTSILMRRLNLNGSLPEEFVNLSHLREIDITRNYLNGSIPAIFGQLRLVRLSLLGNGLSGRIPEEIGNITTLEELVLEDNLLEGNLPASLGSLRNLRMLQISANNFNGTIPETYGNLRNLTDLFTPDVSRIDGSNLSGRIPDFIGNWTKLDRLDLQGTSMEGPIPATLSLLRNLTELRISDLRGPSTSFPNLQDMTAMVRLILRNCSITGPIPLYIGNMSVLNTLDLSFNMLNGTIPTTFVGLRSLNFMFLSHNSLTGGIPEWIMDRRNNMDLSYNNFTEVSWCLRRDLPCSGSANHHSLFINCGGGRTRFEGNEYDEDLSDQGPSHFESNDRWGYSSTGVYMGNDRGRFTATSNSTMIEGNAEFYQTSRLSPSSLKYYGLCMRSGSYRVRLYFAEIMYSDDSTFSNLGRRIFDVAIQGEVVLPDFDIAREANGVRRGIHRDFNVLVNGSTLEIHLYWTGKGTTALPERGVYGPLISAIAVTPNFDVSTGGLSVGIIVGIVVSSCVVVLLILFVLWKRGYLGGKNAEDNELRGLDLQTGYFSLRQLKAATNNFDIANKIGEGGFGPVYKGVLSDGTVIAVKQLSSKSKQGNREFVNEIGMISALQHPNLVKLFGCCIQGNQLLLIYEYLENNSLARALFGRADQKLNLDWSTRKKICMGIAKGLAYLHEESRLKIVHRDIKATNVLLDKDLNAKISDFGLAKLDEEENTHISTRIAGTIGYMAPEYAMRGYLTDKADVYSFGIVALEIVSGRSNTNYRPKEEFVYLLDWAYVLQEQGNLLDLVDPSLESDYSKSEALRMLNLSLLCANPSPTLRPSMSSVVSMLEGKTKVQAPLVKRGDMNEDARFKAFEILSHDSQTRMSTFSQDSREQTGVSTDGPWVDSSVSLTSKDESRDHSSASKLLPDLYNVRLD
ncbi:hypothetical protein OROHE_022305 [Orobanche hederae]